MNRLQKKALGLGIGIIVLMLQGCVEKGEPVKPEDSLFRTGVVQNESYVQGSISKGLLGSSYILPDYTFSIRINGSEEVYNVRGFDVAEAADTLINPGDSVNIYKMPNSFPNVRTVGGVWNTENNFRTAMKNVGAIDISEKLYLQKIVR